MARNQGPINPEDDSQFYRAKSERSRDGVRSGVEDETAALDSRMLDLDVDEQSPFLRAQKRVPVRRGSLPKKTAVRLRFVLILLIVLGTAGGVGAYVYHYGTHSWRFRIDSSDSIEVAGSEHVTRSQIVQIFAPDLSRNIFFVPLAERKKQIEEIPWVESAAVMRLLPNRISVRVTERKPVAYVQIGSRVDLIDGDGIIMRQPSNSPDTQYSFPVIIGMNDKDPLSTRAARMKLYQQLMRELDGGGSQYSQDINEVDLQDPEDLRVTVADQVGAVVIHLGSENFLERYKIYVAHVQEWRQQYPKLNSVDLRYERQVIVNPDMRAEAAAAQEPPEATPAPAPAKPAPTKAAAAKSVAAKPKTAKPGTAKPAPKPVAAKAVPAKTVKDEPAPFSQKKKRR